MTTRETLINKMQIEKMYNERQEVQFTDGREAIETLYHFKIKNQDINQCKFMTTISIQTEKQIATEQFGEILIQLRKLNTRHKSFFRSTGMSGDRVF